MEYALSKMMHGRENKPDWHKRNFQDECPPQQVDPDSASAILVFLRNASPKDPDHPT
jgi:hypothetical protein